jgi:hypothetical protein
LHLSNSPFFTFLYVYLLSLYDNIAEEKAKRKAKKAKKMEKEAKRLAQAQQNGPDAVYSDEAGAGESAGVTTEWGWANEMDERVSI